VTIEAQLAIAVALLRRVLDDDNFGIGLSTEIREFLRSQSAASADPNV
jgi:hypothetical protein